MSDIAIAFEKAGLPTASVAFAAACHDLARLALNKQPDPERAVTVALGMMSGNGEFRMRLKQFLAEVASERPGKAKSDGEAQPSFSALALGEGMARLSDPNGDAEDQSPAGANGAHSRSVPASPPLSGGVDQGTCGGNAAQLAGFPPSDSQDGAVDQSSCGAGGAQVPRVPASSLPSDGADHSVPSGGAAQTTHLPPSESRLRALTRTKEVTASAYGFYITERQGSRTPIEQIEVSRLESLCAMTGRRTMASMVENYTLSALRRRMPAWSAEGTRVQDVFSAPEITDAIESARLSVSDMLAMPKERRLDARA